MYEIYVDDLLIHSDVTPSDVHKVLEPKLTMEDCAAGSLEFTIPPGNVGYDSIQKLISDIIVFEDGEELWRGRPMPGFVFVTIIPLPAILRWPKLI